MREEHYRGAKAGIAEYKAVAAAGPDSGFERHGFARVAEPSEALAASAPRRKCRRGRPRSEGSAAPRVTVRYIPAHWRRH
jgi:hypothetical protein